MKAKNHHPLRAALAFSAGVQLCGRLGAQTLHYGEHRRDLPPEISGRETRAHAPRLHPLTSAVLPADFTLKLLETHSHARLDPPV